METPNDIRVTSWEELNELVFKDSWRESLQRFRSPFAFRGCADVAYDMKTSLMRLGGNYERLEQGLLRNFKQYAFRDASPGNSLWNWLAVAQHHGLPTRLLDWTHSPYVAAHFATAELDKYDRDGLIWCVPLNIMWEQSLPEKLSNILRDEYASLFNVDMLNGIASSLQEFDRLSNDPFVIFFHPPALDQRIVNQYAIFSMMSSPTAQLDQWLLQHPQTFFRIIIPASLKWEIRDKLDQINITERVLFPGMDGLSSWLRRYYSPRAK